MLRGLRNRRLAVSCFCVVGLALFVALPVRAEFPPDGAVADPTNPWTATGNLPDAKHGGSLVPYVFYFDCTKKLWIGVAVAGSKGGEEAAPNAVGTAREFPPGPPTGAKLDGHDPKRAVNRTTGRAFAMRDGNWVDAKSGAVVKAPKLCSGANDVPTVKDKPISEEPRLPEQQGPASPVPVGPEPKSDLLPPPPKVITH